MRDCWARSSSRCSRATAAAGAGAIAATSLGDALQATLAAVIAATTYTLILLALQRRDLMSLARLVRGAVRPAAV